VRQSTAAAEAMASGGQKRIKELGLINHIVRRSHWVAALDVIMTVWAAKFKSHALNNSWLLIATLSTEDLLETNLMSV